MQSTSHACRSKRLQQAVKGITRAPNPELMMEDTGPDTPQPARKKSKKAKAGGAAAASGVLAAQDKFPCATPYFADGWCAYRYVLLLYFSCSSSFDNTSMTAGSAGRASQLGVFADRSDSDEELLAALAMDIPSTEKPLKRGQGSRGRAKLASSGAKHAFRRP